MAKETYIRLRCTSEFKQQIEVLASKENRTVSNYIENLLIAELEKENKNMKTKLSFEEFLNKIYNIGLAEYMDLNEMQKKAIDINYKDNYK